MWGALAGLATIVIVAVWILSSLGIVHISSATASLPGGGKGGKAVASSADAAAILKEAKKYDSLSYVWGGGHPPAAWHSGQGLDCSGMIDLAVLKVTGINENNTARDFRNSGHWSAISMSQAREGDIVYLLKERHPDHEADHVAIVVDNHKSLLTVFEAYTSGIRQDLQIRQHAGYSYDTFDGALRFHR